MKYRAAEHYAPLSRETTAKTASKHAFRVVGLTVNLYPKAKRKSKTTLEFEKMAGQRRQKAFCTLRA